MRAKGARCDKIDKRTKELPNQQTARRYMVDKDIKFTVTALLEPPSTELRLVRLSHNSSCLLSEARICCLCNRQQAGYVVIEVVQEQPELFLIRFASKTTRIPNPSFHDHPSVPSHFSQFPQHSCNVLCGTGYSSFHAEQLITRVIT